MLLHQVTNIFKNIPKIFPLKRIWATLVDRNKKRALRDRTKLRATIASSTTKISMLRSGTPRNRCCSPRVGRKQGESPHGLKQYMYPVFETKAATAFIFKNGVDFFLEYFAKERKLPIFTMILTVHDLPTMTPPPPLWTSQNHTAQGHKCIASAILWMLRSRPTSPFLERHLGALSLRSKGRAACWTVEDSKLHKHNVVSSAQLSEKQLVAWWMRKLHQWDQSLEVFHLNHTGNPGQLLHPLPILNDSCQCAESNSPPGHQGGNKIDGETKPSKSKVTCHWSPCCSWICWYDFIWFHFPWTKFHPTRIWCYDHWACTHQDYLSHWSSVKKKGSKIQSLQ